MTRRLTSWIAAILLIPAALLVAPLVAQRGGGGGGAGGGTPLPTNRLGLLTMALSLSDEQKKGVKTVLDAEYKAAAPLRDALGKSRLALGLAIQNQKTPAEVEDATKQVRRTVVTDGAGRDEGPREGPESPDRRAACESSRDALGAQHVARDARRQEVGYVARPPVLLSHPGAARFTEVRTAAPRPRARGHSADYRTDGPASRPPLDLADRRD